jgi:pimeloyl-ACP methyl ester carboxylesterase
MLFWVTEQFMKTARHASFYLASGAETGPLIIFVHGWPELSHSWRHQLRCFGALGFRCVAPDMRGYGRSSSHITIRPGFLVFPGGVKTRMAGPSSARSDIACNRSVHPRCRSIKLRLGRIKNTPAV